MSAKEMAHNIINKLSEEQLKGFIAMFGELYPVTDDKISKKETAFEELEKLRRPISDIDEIRELSNWRSEKYGI